MNAQDRNKDLKVHKTLKPDVKSVFGICEVTNNLTNLKNKKKI